jgi:hypothetical protein
VSEALIALKASLWAGLFAPEVVSGICLAAVILLSLLLATLALVTLARADTIAADRLFFDDDLDAFGDEPLELTPPVSAGKRGGSRQYRKRS